MKFKVNAKTGLHLQTKNGKNVILKVNDTGNIDDYNIADIIHLATNSVPNILSSLIKAGKISQYPTQITDLQKIALAQEQTNEDFFPSITLIDVDAKTIVDKATKDKKVPDSAIKIDKK